MKKISLVIIATISIPSCGVSIDPVTNKPIFTMTPEGAKVISDKATKVLSSGK